MMIHKSKGWVKLWREITESSLFENHNAYVLFSYILCHASFKEEKKPVFGQDMTVKPGMLVTGRKSLATNTHLTEQKIRTSMGYLISTNRITSKTTNRFTIIQVQNWEKYQNDNQEDNQVSNQQITNKQPTDNQQATTIEECIKKDKNVKKEKNKDIVFDNTNTRTSVKKNKTDIQPIVRINYQFFVDTWNKTLSPKVLSLSKDRISHIRARCTQDVEFFVHFQLCIPKIKDSPFLRGENKKGWRATFDWLISSPRNYLKVLEGNYTKEETIGGLTKDEYNRIIQES